GIALDLQPAAPHGAVQLTADRRARQAGAGLEVAQGEAFDQAQRVEHVVERAVFGGDRIVAADRGGGAGVGQVVARVLHLPAPADLAGGAQGELAVGAGADAEVIAEAPVVEIVPALPPGPGIGADLVLGVTGLGQAGDAGVLHVPGTVLVG